MKPERTDAPAIVVLSSLFPSRMQPGAGLFIRERMFRVGRCLPLAVVSPTPWFPLQGLLRRWRRGFRAGAPAHEIQQGIDVWYPRFFSVPGLFKGLDGWFMAIGAWPRMRRLKRAGRLDVIDAHFAYPDGYAATLLGRWLGVPVTITMRGTEARHARDPALAAKVAVALQRARRVFSVSESLRQVALGLGIDSDHVRVVGNGVDVEKFSPVPRAQARAALSLPTGVPVLVTIGALVERKGFHRVIELLPALRERFPGLTYLVVGGPSPEGDLSGALERQVAVLGLRGTVRFLGALPPEELRVPLSAADVFVLATRNEGWANVLLEAMACGLPVIATDVGGNAEVVCSSSLGTIVAFDDAKALEAALDEALRKSWDVCAIRSYAHENTWEHRVQTLLEEFRALHAAQTRSTIQSARRATHA
ncbi:MAG: glycosyltransferase [Polyangiaceae bacterium]|nr:glycosyltransferase [Polyangiaceae bacterium]